MLHKDMTSYMGIGLSSQNELSAGSRQEVFPPIYLSLNPLTYELPDSVTSLALFIIIFTFLLSSYLTW